MLTYLIESHENVVQHEQLLAEMYLKPLRFRVTRTSSCSKQVAWRDCNEIWQHGILFETASNLIFDITHCTVSQNWEDSPSKWIGGWHWFQILEHAWLEYMHWNCLDPSYLILHSKYVQRVAADRSVARQAFGLRDVGRSGAMIQDGFQKNKKLKLLSKYLVIGMNIFFFQPTVQRDIDGTISAQPHPNSPSIWNSRISGTTLLKCASLQVLFWHCLGGGCNETDIYSSYKIHENMIHTSGWRILMHFKKSSCHLCFAESLSHFKQLNVWLFDISVQLRPRLSCRLATCHNEHWKNEGKNPTVRWSNRFFPIVGDVSVGGWMNCQTLSLSNLNAGLCSIVHGLKVSQTTIALVACQSASNIFRILLHRVAAMSKL